MTGGRDESAIRLFLDEDMEAAELSPIAGGQVAVFTARSPDKDDGKSNEDSIALYPLGERLAVIAIADGSGGLPLGDEASKIALKELGKALRSLDLEADRPRTAILNGVENANEAIKALGVGAATTLVVAQVDGDSVRPYHVGDSGVLLVGNRGKVRLQTIAHSPVGYAVEAGMLDEKGAMFHEDRNLVSNLMGFDEMRIDIGPKIHMRPLDTLVLGSDGLFDNLHLKEIIEIVRKGPLKRAAQALRTACERRMRSADAETTPSKPDDLAFAIFRRR